MQRNPLETRMTNKPTVYLAGPILGQTHEEANDWRTAVAAQLADHGIVAISPLRCEPLIGPRYSAGYPCPKFGTARAIGSKNFFDVRTCDMTLAYLPRLFEPGAYQSHTVEDMRRLQLPPSIGTIIELAWAMAFDKPAVVVSDNPLVATHPVIDACAGWLVEDLQDGVDILVGVLGDYAVDAL